MNIDTIPGIFGIDLVRCGGPSGMAFTVDLVDSGYEFAISVPARIITLITTGVILNFTVLALIKCTAITSIIGTLLQIYTLS